VEPSTLVPDAPASASAVPESAALPSSAAPPVAAVLPPPGLPNPPAAPVAPADAPVPAASALPVALTLDEVGALDAPPEQAASETASPRTAKGILKLFMEALSSGGTFVGECRRPLVHPAMETTESRLSGTLTFTASVGQGAVLQSTLAAMHWPHCCGCIAKIRAGKARRGRRLASWSRTSSRPASSQSSTICQ